MSPRIFIRVDSGRASAPVPVDGSSMTVAGADAGVGFGAV